MKIWFNGSSVRIDFEKDSLEIYCLPMKENG
jgi:hypothetical protein